MAVVCLLVLQRSAGDANDEIKTTHQQSSLQNGAQVQPAVVRVIVSGYFHAIALWRVGRGKDAWGSMAVIVTRQHRQDNT